MVFAVVSNTPIIGLLREYTVAWLEYGLDTEKPTTSKYDLPWSCETICVARLTWFSPAANPCSPSRPGMVSGWFEAP
jgi:hypothetical protein